ncbi:hypothetical protein ScPMuIL_001185 [Solemya velum]
MLSVESLFTQSRFPSGLDLLPIILYIPIGLLLVLVRVFILIHTVIISCLLPRCYFRACVLRTMYGVLGLQVLVVEDPKTVKNAKILVSNHVSPLDHCVIDQVRPNIQPDYWDMHSVWKWIFGYKDMGVSKGHDVFEENIKKHCAESDIPLLFHPERTTTSGRVGLLKFRLLSEYAKELSQLIGESHPLFIWDEWVRHIGMKLSELQMKTFIFGQSDIRDVRNVDVFLENYRILSKQKGRFSDNRKRDKKFQRKVRDDIKQPLVTLSEKWQEVTLHQMSPSKELTASKFANQSYDPSSVATMFDEDPVGFLLEKDLNQSQSKFEKKDYFRYSTIKYITQPDTFLDDLDKQGLSDFTIYSSCKDSSSESDEFVSDSSNLCSDNKRKRKKKISTTEAVVRHAVAKCRMNTPTKHQIQNKSKFDDLMKKLMRAHENYVVYRSPKFQRHRSYHWLISMCSDFIECNLEHLDEEVKKLEMVYFLEKNELNASEAVSLRQWLKKFFCPIEYC